MRSKQTDSNVPMVPVVPREYGGNWIAWNFEGTRIIASGNDLKDAEFAAREAGEVRPRLEKVPGRLIA